MATPLCEYFGKCGGCSLQHVDYATQLLNKKNYLKNASAQLVLVDCDEYLIENKNAFLKFIEEFSGYPVKMFPIVLNGLIYSNISDLILSFV